MNTIKSIKKVFQGTGISNNRCAGTLHFFEREPIKRGTFHKKCSKEEEWTRLERAIKETRKRISELQEQVAQSIGDSEAQIFEIHGMLLEDEDFLDALKEEISSDKCAEDALEYTAEKFAVMFTNLNDPYLSARATDIKDVSAQVLKQLLNIENSNRQTRDEPYILVADDLSPSETVTLEKSKILGFVTFRGTTNSHTAILARAMGIPALIDVGTIDKSYDGTYALLDAVEGTLTVCPTDDEKRDFLDKQSKDDRIAKEHERYLRTLMNKPAVTRSGHRMLIYANIGDPSDVEAVLANGADGIGLLRSEFLYLGSTDYPSEETLFRAYSNIAIKMQGKRAVIRTLDIGADKKIAYFGLPEEENPALGFRAIRICLSREEVFKTQLRAILRASAFGNISVMIPMIVSVDEVRQTKKLLEECKDELRQRGEKFDSEMEFGIMIETPAAAVMCEELAREVNFFSVGTNDLTQYTLAADRQNAALARLCDENREPVLRFIEKSAEAIHKNGGWIGICGEMAADLHLTQRFCDMRIDELSVSAPYLLGVRGKVCDCK